MRVSSEQFVCISKESDLAVLKQALKERLPNSAHEYNILLCKQWFPKGVDVYTLDGNVGPNAIVLLKILRKDYAQDLSISTPLDFLPTECLRQALTNTKVIDWDTGYFFASFDPKLYPVLADISKVVKNHPIELYADYQFIFDVDEALQLDFTLESNVELRPLDEATGAKFLTDNWDYAKPGTLQYVQTVLKNNPSAGVFVDGKLVCGALVNIHGTVGLLFTDQAHRRHGYAQVCVKYICKEMAKRGMIPCSTAQTTNDKSINFHKTLGMKLTHESYYIHLHSP